jgi:hypothetical protein
MKPSRVMHPTHTAETLRGSRQHHASKWRVSAETATFVGGDRAQKLVDDPQRRSEIRVWRARTFALSASASWVYKSKMSGVAEPLDPGSPPERRNAETDHGSLHRASL